MISQSEKTNPIKANFKGKKMLPSMTINAFLPYSINAEYQPNAIFSLMRIGDFGKIQRTLFILMRFLAKSELIEASWRRQTGNVAFSRNLFYLLVRKEHVMSKKNYNLKKRYC